MNFRNLKYIVLTILISFQFNCGESEKEILEGINSATQSATVLPNGKMLISAGDQFYFSGYGAALSYNSNENISTLLTNGSRSSYFHTFSKHKRTDEGIKARTLVYSFVQSADSNVRISAGKRTDGIDVKAGETSYNINSMVESEGIITDIILTPSNDIFAAYDIVNGRILVVDIDEHLITQNIPVQNLSDMKFSTDGNSIIALDAKQSKLLVIDHKNGEITKDIQLQYSPLSLEIAQLAKVFFVSYSGKSLISVFSESFEEIGQIGLRYSGTDFLKYDNFSNSLYGVNPLLNSVAVMRKNGSDWQYAGEIPVANVPTKLSVTTDEEIVVLNSKGDLFFDSASMSKSGIDYVSSLSIVGPKNLEKALERKNDVHQLNNLNDAEKGMEFGQSDMMPSALPAKNGETSFVRHVFYISADFFPAMNIQATEGENLQSYYPMTELPFFNQLSDANSKAKRYFNGGFSKYENLWNQMSAVNYRNRKLISASNDPALTKVFSRRLRDDFYEGNSLLKHLHETEITSEVYGLNDPENTLTLENELKKLDEYFANGNVPQFNLIYLPDLGQNRKIFSEDDLESYKENLDSVIKTVVEKIFNSNVYAESAIFIVDNSGGDPYLEGRNLFTAVGPYIRKGYTEQKFVTPGNILRTIELLLGVAPMNYNDAAAEPLRGMFTNSPNTNSLLQK